MFVLTYRSPFSNVNTGKGVKEGMKQSVRLRIIAIIVLIILSVIDAVSIFVPIVAIVGIIIFLFKPKWFLNFVEKIYE